MRSPFRMFAAAPFLSTRGITAFKIPLLPDFNKGIFLCITPVRLIILSRAVSIADALAVAGFRSCGNSRFSPDCGGIKMRLASLVIALTPFMLK